MPARLSLGFVGLLAVVPFLQYRHYYPITDFYTEWFAFLVGLFAAGLLLKRWSGVPVAILAPAGLILLVWLQFSLGRIDYAEQAQWFSLYLLWGALLLIVGYQLKKELGMPALAETLSWFLAAGGLASAALGLLQHYSIHTALDSFITPNSDPAVYGNLAQRNHFADYIALALASLLYLSGRRKLSPALFFLATLPLLFALALSGSRTAWFFLFAMPMLALWLDRRNPGRDQRQLLIRAAWLPAGFVLVQALAHLPFFTPQGMESITSTDRLFSLGGSNSVRLDLWRQALSMFWSSPWFGVGFGQFAWNHFIHAANWNHPEDAEVFTNAHNFGMQILAEGGILGGAIVFGGLGWWLLRTRARPADLHSWWLYSLLAIMGIHSVLEYPLWYSHFFGLFMLLLGIGESRAFDPGPELIPKAIAAAALIFGAVLLAQSMRDYQRLEALLYPRYHYGENPPPVKPAELYQALWKLRANSLLAPYAEYPFAGMMSLDSQELDAKLEINTRANRFSPAGIIAYRQAIYLALAGKKTDAELQFKRAAKTSPELLGGVSETLLGLAATQPAKLGVLVKVINQLQKEHNAAIHYR